MEQVGGTKIHLILLFISGTCYAIFLNDLLLKLPKPDVSLTLFGPMLIKINTVSANFNNTRPSLILNS